VQGVDPRAGDFVSPASGAGIRENASDCLGHILHMNGLQSRAASADQREHWKNAGDVEALVAVLDPDVVFQADVPGRPGAPVEVRGARTWAKGAIAYGSAAALMQPALVNGSVGLILAPRGRLLRALTFDFAEGRIRAAEVISDPARVRALEVAVLA
jgi:hypothetical protein